MFEHIKDIYISRFVAVRYLPHPKKFVKKDKEKLKKVLTNKKCCDIIYESSGRRMLVWLSR